MLDLTLIFLKIMKITFRKLTKCTVKFIKMKCLIKKLPGYDVGKSYFLNMRRQFQTNCLVQPSVGISFSICLNFLFILYYYEAFFNFRNKSCAQKVIPHLHASLATPTHAGFLFTFRSIYYILSS